MICKKCGTKIPDGAKFCGECGWVVDEKEAEKAEKEAIEREKKRRREQSPSEVLRLRKQVKKYRILTWVFGILFVLMVIAFAGSDMVEDTSSTAPEVPDGAFALTGTYIVGEDEELPAGSYDITSIDEYGTSVKIYENVENYKADKGSNDSGEEQKYLEWFFSKEVKGYKLRDGYVVVIDDPGAFFTPRSK